MRTIEDIAKYQKDYKRKIRAISLPDHEYEFPTHCRQCFRSYNNQSMRDRRREQKCAGVPEPCGDCDPCLGGRPDQCAITAVAGAKP